MSYLADLLALAGLGAVVYGIAQFSGPVAWIVGGLAALAIGLREAWIRGRRRGRLH